jgi:putative transposase
MTVIIENQPTTIKCKNCGSEHVIKFGSYKGVPRYYCKDCKRKFKADDTAFHTKYPLAWESSAVNMYFRGMAISDIRENLKQEHGYSPSKSVIYKWIDKYTELASKQFRNIQPQVGDVWLADETMVDIDRQHKVWFYDIIDRDTRFLLASRVTLSRTTHDAEMLMRDAEKRAGKKPLEVITDQNNSYMDGIYKAFGSNTEHIQGGPFKHKETNESTSEIERFHGTLKDRTKVFRAFRDVETLIQFTQGWLIYYNYFKTHESLDGKTPAEDAHVDYKVKNWVDLAKVPVSKESEIETHTKPKIKVVIEKVSLEKALKRRRGPNPRGDTSQSKNWRKERRITKGVPRATDLGADITHDRRGTHLRLY